MVGHAMSAGSRLDLERQPRFRDQPGQSSPRTTAPGATGPSTTA